METSIPISELQSQAKKVIERVKNSRDTVLITQRGKPAALLVNCEDYEGMVATLEEMSEWDWRERLAEAERDSQAGRSVTLEEFKARQAKRGKSHIVVEESRQNRRAARSLNRFLDALGDKQISPQS